MSILNLTGTETIPLNTSPSPPVAPILPGHSAPSQRLINEAALIIYGRWRRQGLSHDEALYWAAFFIRRTAITTMLPGSRLAPRSDILLRPDLGDIDAVQIAIAAIVGNAMVVP